MTGRNARIPISFRAFRSTTYLGSREMPPTYSNAVYIHKCVGIMFTCQLASQAFITPRPDHGLRMGGRPRERRSLRRRVTRVATTAQINDVLCYACEAVRCLARGISVKCKDALFLHVATARSLCHAIPRQTRAHPRHACSASHHHPSLLCHPVDHDSAHQTPRPRYRRSLGRVSCACFLLRPRSG